jgi:hypothetical protein
VSSGCCRKSPCLEAIFQFGRGLGGADDGGKQNNGKQQGFRGHVKEHNLGELEDYAKSLGALAQQYMQPEAGRIQAAGTITENVAPVPVYLILSVYPQFILSPVHQPYLSVPGSSILRPGT